MAETTLKGNKIRGKLHAPRANDEERFCVHKGCATKLSRYNKREWCYTHAPTKFPRLRGRVVTDS